MAAEADLEGRAPVLEGEGVGDRYRELFVGSELRELGKASKRSLPVAVSWK
jgi:hypothetical protein